MELIDRKRLKNGKLPGFVGGEIPGPLRQVEENKDYTDWSNIQWKNSYDDWADQTAE